ncbi:MAG: hypothetical protein WAX04_05180 [Oscillospiraceae bacterium]
MASDCNLLDSNGNVVTCTPSETGILITKFDGTNTSSFTVTPSFSDCIIDSDQLSDLFGIGFMSIFAALSVMYLKRTIKF